MQNDRDTATHDRESAKSSASIALGTLGRMSEWFARPVLFVSDVDRSVDFHANRGYRVMVIFPILPLSP